MEETAPVRGQQAAYDLSRVSTNDISLPWPDPSAFPLRRQDQRLENQVVGGKARRMSERPPEPPSSPDDTFDDAFTRWCIENAGARPTPEIRRRFYKPVMRLVMWSEDDHDRLVGDLLIKGDLAGGVDPFDADEWVADAKAAGVDISDDPDLAYLRRVSDEARARRAACLPPGDPITWNARSLSRKIEALHRRERRKTEVAFKGRKSASRKSREKWRRDSKRDAAILSEMTGFFEVEVGVRMAGSQAALVRAKKSTKTTGIEEAVVVFPHWEKSSDVMRAFGMASAAGAMGARDFTIHLNDAVLDYALGGDGQSFAKRMLRRITDALAAKFRAVGLQPPGIMFFVEQGMGERPHVHGVVLVPNHPDALSIIRDALKQAAGSPWKSTPTIDTQVDIGGLPEPVGWIDYITKFRAITEAHIGASTFAASQSMRAIGREWYEKGRREGASLLPRKAVALR